VRELIQRLARENGHWGYVRIVGELRKLGIRVSATLVRNVRHGLAAAAVRAVLRLDRDAQDRVRRLHAQPGYGVDDAAAFNLVMDLDDRGQRPRFLIHDRDKKFSRAFDAILRGEGITIIRTPIQAPKANACAERSVGSARRECLDRLLIFGHRQLEHVLRTYIRRFNEQRPHRALDLRPPDRQGGTDPPPTATVLPLRVRRRDLLGGPLHEYEAAA
jgi:transposase InsO family protein